MGEQKLPLGIRLLLVFFFLSLVLVTVDSFGLEEGVKGILKKWILNGEMGSILTGIGTLLLVSMGIVPVISYLRDVFRTTYIVPIHEYLSESEKMLIVLQRIASFLDNPSYYDKDEVSTLRKYIIEHSIINNKEIEYLFAFIYKTNKTLANELKEIETKIAFRGRLADKVLATLDFIEHQKGGDVSGSLKGEYETRKYETNDVIQKATFYRNADIAFCKILSAYCDRAYFPRIEKQTDAIKQYLRELKKRNEN